MKKHILCIGDSNTHGLCTDPSENADHGSRYNEEERWTCLLQKALGEEYLVIEEGQSGRTCVYEDPAMDSVNLLPVLHALLNSHEPLDLLILMLGTNDAKKKFGTDAKKITKGMQILVEEAKSVPCWGADGPKILIVAPVPIEEGVTYPEFAPDCVETTKALAREYAFLAVAEQVDFLDAGGCELTKADHVHLTAKGHRQLAERMETAVREILEAPEAEGEGGKENDEAEEIVTAKRQICPESWRYMTSPKPTCVQTAIPTSGTEPIRIRRRCGQTLRNSGYMCIKRTDASTGYSCFYWRRNRPMLISRAAAGGRRHLTEQSIVWQEMGK